MTAVLNANHFIFQAEDPTTPGTFLTLAGQRTTKETFTSALVDVTNKDSGSSWRQIGDGMGLQHVQLSCNCIFSDTASHAAMKTYCQNQTIFPGRVVNTDTLKGDVGNFKITQLELTGDHENAIMGQYTIESDSQVLFDQAITL